MVGTSGVEGRCLHVSGVPVVGAAFEDVVEEGVALFIWLGLAIKG